MTHGTGLVCKKATLSGAPCIHWGFRSRFLFCLWWLRAVHASPLFLIVSKEMTFLEVGLGRLSSPLTC